MGFSRVAKPTLERKIDILSGEERERVKTYPPEDKKEYMLRYIEALKGRKIRGLKPTYIFDNRAIPVEKLPVFRDNVDKHESDEGIIEDD